MRLLLLGVLLLVSELILATHIVGGVAEYQILNNTSSDSTSTVSFTFTLYRDANSGGADFDDDADFGLYQKGIDGEYTFYKVGTTSPVNINSYQFFPSIFLIESGDYLLEFELEKGFDYIIAYQRCCRSQNISNINNPQSDPVGLAIQLEIFSEALEVDINSPIIEGLPFAQTELGKQLEYQLPIITDSLTEFTTYFDSAFIAGGDGGLLCDENVRPDPEACPPPFDTINYIDDYSARNPFGDQNEVLLSTEGLISGVFNIISNYQYGIAIESRHNDTLLSRQLLDNVVRADFLVGTKETSYVDFEIFPNPLTDILNVSIDNSEELTLEISNIYGHKIVTKTLGQMSNSISLNHLASGIYFATILNKKTGTLSTKKFVIE